MIHFHKYEVVGADKYIDVSWGYNIPRTQVYLKCSKCRKVKTDHIDGHWNYKLLK